MPPHIWPPIPHPVVGIDAIILHPDLQPGMVFRVTGPLVAAADIPSRNAHDDYQRLMGIPHFVIVLDIDRAPGAQSVTVAFTRTFGHRTHIGGLLSPERCSAWMPVTPARREAGMVHSPIQGLRVNPDQTFAVDHIPCWVYVRKAFKFRVGYQIPGAHGSTRGPVPIFYPTVSVDAIIRALAHANATIEVVGA